MVDDILDYTCSPEELGKPGAGADLGAGLRTAPLLLAARRDQVSTRLLLGMLLLLLLPLIQVLARLLEDGGEGEVGREELVRRVVAAGGVTMAVEVTISSTITCILELLI